MSKEQGIPRVRDIDIADIEASLSPDYRGKSYAFRVNAYSEEPMRDIRMKNVSIKAYEFGSVSHIKDWKLDHVRVDICQNPDFTE